MCHPSIRVIIGFCSCPRSHSLSSKRVCDTSQVTDYVGMKKTGPHLWGGQSLVKGREDRGRCKEKRSRNQGPSRKRTAGALSSWETPCHFSLFHSVCGWWFWESSYSFPQRLYSHVPPRSKPGPNHDIDGDFEQSRAPITFHPWPGMGWGGQAHGLVAWEQQSWCQEAEVDGIHFCLEKSVTRKVNPSHPLWVTGLAN